MKILCIGDIMGKAGRNALVNLLPPLKKEFNIECTIVNAENAAGGAGLTPGFADEFLRSGCDCLTLGDHVWDQKELESYLTQSKRVIRPANFPSGVPGRGFCVVKTASGHKVGIINLMGRVFMRHMINCPFRELDIILETIKKETSVIVVDMHAEATSEKVAMGHYANGRVSAVFGTHTHIQTADEKILSQGTAYITDLGMTGPYDSVIGQNKDIIIQRFLTSMPIKFSVADEEVYLCGVVVDVDPATGKALSIKRLQRAWA